MFIYLLDICKDSVSFLVVPHEMKHLANTEGVRKSHSRYLHIEL